MNQNKKTEVKVCPECNSTDIKEKGNLIVAGNIYRCNNCGHTGVLFPVMAWEDAKKLKVKTSE